MERMYVTNRDGKKILALFDWSIEDGEWGGSDLPSYGGGFTVHRVMIRELGRFRDARDNELPYGFEDMARFHCSLQETVTSRSK